MSWKVLVTDDRDEVRDALVELVSADRDFRVVGEAADGAEAARKCELLAPDLVLMDVLMRPVNGIAGTRLIKARMPDVKVLGLTAFAHREWLEQMLANGASGCLAKESTAQEWMAMMRAVLQCGTGYVFSSGVVDALAPDIRLSRAALGATSASGPSPALTLGQLAIVDLVRDGCSNREIARALSLTEGSVKVTMSRIMARLDVKNRVQVVNRCRGLGLIEP